jgi:tetratricopeptide (TPR) repeat protein
VLTKSAFTTSAIAALLVLLLFGSLGAQEKKKEWKDRGEYDLYESITKTQDPNQWLATLDKWKQQYPQSDYADVRRLLYLETYRALNKPQQAFDAAEEVLKDNPNSLVALSAIVGYVYTLVPFGANSLTSQQQADMDAADKAAHQILSNLDTIYAKENRPPVMTDAQASQAKPQLAAFAQKTLGYIALEKKDYKTATTELTKALQMDPNQAQVSFWLGTALLAQNQTNPEVQPQALYDFARAAAYDGPGALPSTDRKQVQDYLTKVYTQYHGAPDGLDTLMATAKTSALPPAGFVLKSKVDIEKDKIAAEEAAARANPMLALWKRIKAELQGPDGAAYFENNMKGAALPAGVNGVDKFRGKIVSMTPETRPKEIQLAIENGTTPDVTLKLDSPLPGKMEPGAELGFDGVAESYTKDPFMVTFNVEKSHIEGWEGRNVPAGKHTVSKKAGANR